MDRGNSFKIKIPSSSEGLQADCSLAREFGNPVVNVPVAKLFEGDRGY
jgi:hypothetical protein